MLIAVFSDSHDHKQNITKALALAEGRGITRGFHLGDFCAPPSFELLASSKITWQCVFGNVDGDRLGALKRVEKYGTMDLANADFREIEIDGQHLFLTHYPDIARLGALSGKYQAAFYGHNHQAAQEMVANTLLANPGEIVGTRFGHPSFGIYDTEKNSFEIVPIT